MKNKYILLAGLLFLFFPKISQATTAPTSRVCTAAKKAGLASCNAHVVTDTKGSVIFNASPAAFGPDDLRHAYSLPGKSSGSRIIAIVDSYDDPTIKNDLDVYSKQYGLPILPLCKSDASASAVPCFQKISQRGTAALPKANGGWAMEIALDVETVHAVCENCSIVLVEATSPNMNNLLMAEDTAIKKGADVISNSWGGPELSQETQFDSHFNHPGVAITVSSGDSGYGVQYPAASPYVTAVGGTTLVLDGSSYKDENAWSGAGSGCSQYESKPSWQTDAKCSGRTVSDVSAVADPATGVAIYTSTSLKGKKGWIKVGGTSLAAPIIAGVSATAGNSSSGKIMNSMPYNLGSKSNLHDVVGGSNGDCTSSYLCAGKTKYDGPTGLGSPKGTGAF